jgi:hypothetical protein
MTSIRAQKHVVTIGAHLIDAKFQELPFLFFTLSRGKSTSSVHLRSNIETLLVEKKIYMRKKKVMEINKTIAASTLVERDAAAGPAMKGANFDFLKKPPADSSLADSLTTLESNLVVWESAALPLSSSFCSRADVFSEKEQN